MNTKRPIAPRRLAAKRTAGSQQRVVRRLSKALKCAVAIIRNDAMACEYHQPETYKIRMRWAKELETEGGIPHEQDATELTNSLRPPLSRKQSG